MMDGQLAVEKRWRWWCWAWPLGLLPMLLGGLWGGRFRFLAPSPNTTHWVLGFCAVMAACLTGAEGRDWLGLPVALLVAGVLLEGLALGRGGHEALGASLLTALAGSGALVAGIALLSFALLHWGEWPEAWRAGLSGGTGDRPAFPFGHPNHLGASMVLALCASSALALRRSRWLGAAALSLLALMATGSRAAWLGALLAQSLLALRHALAWQGKEARPSGRQGLVALALAAVALGGMAIAMLWNPWWHARWLAMLPSHPSFDHARLAAWAQAWKLVESSPWWGWGMQGWALAPKVLAQPLPHPHQVYLHLALMMGLPLTLLALSLAWGAVLRAWRLQGLHAWPVWALSSALAAWLAMGWVDESILEGRLLLLAIAFTAMMWAWPKEPT